MPDEVQQHVLTAVDLFSGCGGLTTGLKAAGFKVVACAEIRQEARDAYRQNHADTYIYNNVFDVSRKHLASTLGNPNFTLDLLAACPPCQGFSRLRTKNRKRVSNDKRNNLIFEVLRIAVELLPRAILIENVPAFLTNWRVERFQQKLRALGYSFISGVLNAADFGVAQRRRRMILLAFKDLVANKLPDPSSSATVTVGDIISNLQPPTATAQILHSMRQKLSPPVMARIRKVPKNGGSRQDLPSDLQLKCHSSSKGFKDVYGRIRWDKVAPTITRFSHNPSKGRYIHPDEDRGLSIFEALLLQGFPAAYMLPVEYGIGKLSSLIGEAFPPPFAAAQARFIAQYLDQFN